MAGSRVMGRPSTSASGPRTHMGHLRSWPCASGRCVTPGSFSPPSCDTNIVGCHVPGVAVRSQKPVCVKRWSQAPRKCSGNVASLRWTAWACTPGPGCTRRGVGTHPGLPQEQTPHRPTRPPGRLGQHRGGSSRGHGALLPTAGQQRPWPPPSRRQALLTQRAGCGAQAPECPVGPAVGSRRAQRLRYMQPRTGGEMLDHGTACDAAWFLWHTIHAPPGRPRRPALPLPATRGTWTPVPPAPAHI